MVEATYRLAPNYWEQEGDIAIGDSEGNLKRLAAPTEEGLFLVRGNVEPVWSSVTDLLLLDSDIATESVGSSFVTGSVLVRRPHHELTSVYTRTGSTTWAKEREDLLRHSSPLVSVSTVPLSTTMQLYYDSNRSIVRLFCTSDIHVTMLVRQFFGVFAGVDVSELFPRNVDIGLTSGANTQIRSFDIESTGVFSVTNSGFELLDLTPLYRDDFFGDFSWYLYVTLFYRY